MISSYSEYNDTIQLMTQWFWVRTGGALFLLLQAILLQLIWAFEPQTADMATAFLAFDIISGLAILAALGFFFLRHVGWLSAMMVQGVSLLISLTIYFNSGLVAAQITMLYGVLMVLYLNSIPVRTAFRSKAATSENNKEI